MKCANARVVPPHGLVEELQEYVQTGYIYIPARKNQRKTWDEQNGYHRELARRNAGIVDTYRRRVSLEGLGDKYYLSVHAIRKIIYQK